MTQKLPRYVINNSFYPGSKREIRLITKSRDDLRDENEKLKQQNQQKTKNQQQQYLFEIFINKYGCKGGHIKESSILFLQLTKIMVLAKVISIPFQMPI